jgi:hypothetical protein
MPLIDDWPFVNAAGFAEQSAFAAPTLVMPLIAMSQVAEPAFIVAAATLMVDGGVKDTVAAHPAPVTVAKAPSVKRSPDGSVSVKAIPVCAGLPGELVSRKLRGVLLPNAMVEAPKLLVSVGTAPVAPTVT